MNHEHTAPAAHAAPVENRREYYKFAGVILGIFIAGALLTSWRDWTLRLFLEDFMAVFLVTFAAFKFVSIETFAAAYRTYDIVGRKFPAWGYIFPFVEGGLGFAYLLTTQNATLNLLTMLISGVAGYGVWQELRLGKTRRRRGHFTRAYLGTVIRLPLSKVSFIEDSAMFIMAALMLLFIR